MPSRVIVRRQSLDAIDLAPFLERARPSHVTFRGAGLTEQGRAPAGFLVDRARVPLGHGPAVFAAARQALRTWIMFPANWCRLYPPRVDIAAGETVIVALRLAGLTWITSSRVMYVIDEVEPTPRFRRESGLAMQRYVAQSRSPVAG